MTDCAGAVNIFVYHVIDSEGWHRFISTNDRFIEYLGGVHEVEARLAKQFTSFELVGTCAVGAENGSGIDERASAEIVGKIREIECQYPNCVPLPQPWSESQYDSPSKHTDKLNDEIMSDLLQVVSAVPNIDAIIAIVHHGRGLLAGSVLRDAAKSGFVLHDGGVPAETSYVSILPAQTSLGSAHWTEIPPEELAMPLMPPGQTQPVAYLILTNDGQQALALAGRRNDGHVGWSGNGDIIDHMCHLLADIGVLVRRRRPEVGA